MRRTINIWWVIAVIACVFVAFFWYSNQLSATIEELQNTVEQGNVRLAALQAENANLEAVLKLAETDAFIENEARNSGYLMPDEIRFVITGAETDNQTEAEISSP